LNGIFDAVAAAVGTITSNAAPPAATQAAPDPSVWPTPPAPPAPSLEDRIVALEKFAVEWGPTIEKLAPLIAKLDTL
jgi:hypothetical protein